VDRYRKSRPTGIRSLDCSACSASVLFELVLCDGALENTQSDSFRCDGSFTGAYNFLHLFVP
jgi:hypothetical protein